MSPFSRAVEAAVSAMREEVARLHAELVRYRLVVWTGGNVSGRVEGSDLFVIKPSGVSYEELTPELMVVCTLDGQVVPGTPGSERAPSSDTAAHAYVYRHLPEVAGVVHTHSPYAVSWAARGEEIPCVTTGDRRRVRRAGARGSVRGDRGRLDRTRHRRDPAPATGRGQCSCVTTARSRSAAHRRTL